MAAREYDSRLIERLALMYQGNAAAHFSSVRHPEVNRDKSLRRWSRHEMLAASSLTLAASYWSLIAPGNAVLQFAKAAEIYRSLGHNYWVVLAFISGRERQIDELSSVLAEMAPLSSQLTALALVANELSDAPQREARAERLDGIWRSTGNVPSGRLAIPLDYYGHWVRVIREARSEKDIRRFFAQSAELVNRATEVLRMASNDRFHWSRFQSGILPAEPEIIALTKAMSMISSSTFDTPILEMTNLDTQARLVVQIGDEMRKAANQEEAY